MDFILNSDTELQIQELVQNACSKKIPLKIFGSNTKSFYGNKVAGHPLCLAGYIGIIHYEPSELVLTARSGTRLRDIETALANEGQMLAFEPPYFGEQATLGGSIACGLSGPRRPYAGAVRDSVLGIKCINGKGEKLTFGGQVIKNVAGYDASRLMVGALGTLGVLLEISLKVVPKPETELTLVCEKNTNEATRFMNTLAAKPLPLSASAYIDGIVYLRLSGSHAAVQAAANEIGSDQNSFEGGSQSNLQNDLQNDLQNNANVNSGIWQQIREHRHPFFNTERPLWRLSVAAGTPVLDIPGDWFIDWGGAQRWLSTNATAKEIRDVVADAGGHATLFKPKRHSVHGHHSGPDQNSDNINNELINVYHPLPPSLAKIHKNLKDAFDPQRILNRNKFYNDT